MTEATQDRRIVLACMARGRGPEPLWPRPSGSAGHRLYAMIRDATGWPMEEYLSRTVRVAFCPGTVWTLDEARSRLEEVRSMIAGRRTIAIGVPAARLLEAPPEWCEWSEDGVAAIPHTAGVSLAYNDPDVRASVVAFLKSALQ